MREVLDDFLNRALDVMSSDGSVDDLLADFATVLQAQLPGCVVGINVLDRPGRTFRKAIFPSLPSSFSSSLENNVITGKRGSCGMGVLTGRTIDVPDDP